MLGETHSIICEYLTLKICLADLIVADDRTRLTVATALFRHKHAISPTSRTASGGHIFTVGALLNTRGTHAWIDVELGVGKPANQLGALKWPTRAKTLSGTVKRVAERVGTTRYFPKGCRGIEEISRIYRPGSTCVEAVIERREGRGSDRGGSQSQTVLCSTSVVECKGRVQRRGSDGQL